MRPSAIRLRGIGLGGRLVAAACLIYTGWIVPAAVNANMATPDGVIRASTSDYRLKADGAQQPWQSDGEFPDTTTDIDQPDEALSGLVGDNDKQDNAHVFVVDLEAITLRLPEIVRTRRISFRCSYHLHEHIHERAPPNLKS